MSRMSPGAWVWSGCSECGVGEGGFVAEPGGAVSSRGPSSVASCSGRVVVVVVGSVMMWASARAGPSCLASVVIAIGGSSLCLVGVGVLFYMAARRSCS